ncbi:unnamed protein product [Linum trigynum]|uniref:Uncharacterized protein n=1 Tax=Linum trigynum TaxID=586398 RepID=A0AAV2CBY1_9ROSI
MVPPEVRENMNKLLTTYETSQKKYEVVKTRFKEPRDTNSSSAQDDGNSAKRVAPNVSTGSIDTFFAPRSSSGSQPGIKSALATKEVVLYVDRAWASWFYDARVPLEAIKSPQFKIALDVSMTLGPGLVVMVVLHIML